MPEEEEKTEETPPQPKIDPAPEGAVEMRVTAKKPAGFYIRAAASFLNGVQEKPAEGDKDKVEAKAPVENLRITGLGEAIIVASTAAAQLVASGLCTISKIQTAYPPMEGSGRSCAQIIIDVKKSLDNMTLDDEFEFRRLKDESELGPWYDLLTAVYGYMGLPRPYFVRHWESDGGHDLAGITVAVDRKSGKMVSTNRVFTRRYQINGGPPEIIGGIGEVSTLPEYQKRGLATRLLRSALEYMQEKGMKCSSLHAYSSGGGIYRRLGWKPVVMPWHNIPVIEAAPAPKKCLPLDIENAWEDVLNRIKPLRERFAENIDGYFRSLEYWNSWVRWPAEALDATGQAVPGLMRGWELLQDDGATQAYLITKSAASFSAGAEAVYAGDSAEGTTAPLNLTVIDFAAASPVGSADAEKDFLALLGAARDAFGGPGAKATASVPKIVAPAACDGAPENKEQSTWHYCDVRTALADFGTDKSAARDPFAQRVRQEAHLVFAIDEF